MRAHVLAAADDDVLLAVGDRQVAVVVEDADVAGHVPAVGGERGGRRRRIGVSDEALRSLAPDLALSAGLDVAPLVVDQTYLDARHRPAVGVDTLVVRRFRGRAGDRRMLGAPEAARRLDAELRGALPDRGRHRRATEPDVRHELGVPVGIEVRMVEEAREEVRRALARRDVVFEHRVENTRRIPDIDEMDRRASPHGNEQRREHADAVTDGRSRQRGRPSCRLDPSELMDLGVDRAV